MAMEAHRVVLANGRSGATTVAAGASAGATSFALVSAAGFVAGDLVFCSESDDTDVEYLGIVTAKDGNTITTNLPLVADKAAGMKVWEPEISARMTAMSGQPQIAVDRGLSVNTRLDGVTTRMKVRDTVSRFVVNYERMVTSDYALLETFWDSSDGANGGLSDFVFACFDYRSETRFVWTVGVTGDLPMFDQAPFQGLCRIAFVLERHSDGYPA